MLKRSIATVQLALFAFAGCTREAPATVGSVRIGFIETPHAAAGSARAGVELGADEAAHAARLIGRSVELLRERADSPPDAVAAARRLTRAGAVAIIGGFDDASCRALSRFSRAEGVLFLNVGCRSAAGRVPESPMMFHVEASDSMYRAGGADPVAGADRPSAWRGGVLWHSDLRRYGAAQLNERFEREAGVAADGPAWAGWMAVKIVWESILRTGTADASALAAFLRGDRAFFDGHKGEQLRFDPASRQLRQSVYPAGAAGRAGRPDEASMIPGSDTHTRVALDGARYAFVTNEGAGSVTVVDLDAQRSVATIPLGARPRGIRVSPDGARVFVALSDNAPTTESDLDAVAVIDVREGKVTARHRVGSDPEQFAIGPGGERLYAANEDAGTASVTDLRSGEVLATLVVGVEPEGVAASPDGRWIYVTAETSNTVSVIDARTNEIAASFLVEVRPRGVAFSPTLPRAYVTNEISGTVSVIDTRAHRVVATVPLPAGRSKPVGVATSPDGARVYVANGHANTVSVIDAATNTAVAEVPVGRRPWGIAVSSDGSWVYTANGGSDDLSVIDAASLRVVHTIPVGDRPWGVAVTP
jgi:PQQ-dependent catabolism-associated beta-propeller protein